MNQGRNPPLYTPEERKRRDASPWTLVQGILAPIQFVVFLASLCLVLRYLATGEGLGLATASVVVKTLTLYAIMITGCIWETRSLRPLPVRPRLLLGRRLQHAGAGAAHGLSGGAGLRRAGCARADVPGARGLRHLRHQRHPVPAEAARRPARAKAAPPSGALEAAR